MCYTGDFPRKSERGRERAMLHLIIPRNDIRLRNFLTSFITSVKRESTENEINLMLIYGSQLAIYISLKFITESFPFPKAHFLPSWKFD